MRKPFAPLIVSLPALLTLVACEGSEPASPGSTPTNITAQLVQATSCDDLLGRIQNEALANVERIADGARDALTKGDIGGVVTPGIGVGPVASQPDLPTAPAGGATGAPGAAPPPSNPVDNGAPTTGGADPAVPQAPEPSGTPAPSGDGNAAESPDFSETNNQVAGVDEADIVKTDGFNLYILHGTELFVVDVAQPNAMTLALDVAVEGQPVEMFVRDGIAVVYSSVSPSADVLGGQPAAESLCYSGYNPYTKMTVVDVRSETAQVLREVYTQGYYVSSRRIDGVVRGVVSGGLSNLNFGYPNVEYYDIFGAPRTQAEIDAQVDAWVELRRADIESTDLEDWLPLQREIVDGAVVPVARDCSSYYVPAPGLVAPGATTVVSLDLADVAGSLGGATILGNVDEVYSNSGKLVLAQRDYRFTGNFDETPEQTALHQFALSGNDTVYEASGFVPGHIVDQFSIDEAAGVIRVATTATGNMTLPDPLFPGSLIFQFVTDNRVYTLGADGGELDVLGRTGPLGHERETVRSSRFIGDKGYVVTFRQTDPLVVVDLSDPTSPAAVGELLIPGFSSYLQPIGEDHLIGIGRDVDPVTNIDQGLALQIFDVSDPAAPMQTAKMVAPGYSSAEGDHKAFNYYPTLGLLAFPFFGREPNYTSTLEVFRVDVGTGFAFVASIDHVGLLDGGCFEELSALYGTAELCAQFPADCVFYEQDIRYQCQSRVGEVRRGVFIDNALYSISSAGVLAHSTADFTETAALDLPEPAYYGGGFYCGGIAVDGVAPPGAVGGGTVGVALPPVTMTPVAADPVPATPAGMGMAAAVDDTEPAQ